LKLKNKKHNKLKIYAVMQSKGFSFEGQNIYIGIDVHLKTWAVAVMTESGLLETYSQESKAEGIW
jgi:hypothetical protein